MKELTSLAWKEWNEVRIYLWIAIGIFIGLPIVGGLEEHWQGYAHFFAISTTPWVVAFGGVLAIFVGVGATCRDFSGHLEDFWRSRPVGIVRWMLVKYFIGLAVVLVACLLPLMIELAVDRGKSAILLVAWFPAMWAALYSVGFLCGCLLRRTAHAAMLALAAMLLVYFLPMVLPPLQWMNATTVTDSNSWGGSPGSWPAVWGAERFKFALGMLGTAIAAVALALAAVRFSWRIESGRKMMYGSVSAAILILFSSAAFRLGTNLPVLGQVDLPQHQWLVEFTCDGSHGRIVTMPDNSQFKVPVTDVSQDFTVTPFEVTATGLKLGTANKVSRLNFWNLNYGTRSPEHPEFRYAVGYTDAAMTSEVYDTLALRANTGDGKVEQVLTLWKEASGSDVWPQLWIWQGKLYVMGTHLVILDISEPLKPKVISDTPFQYSFNRDYEDRGSDELILLLPPVPDFPPRERLSALLQTRLGDRYVAIEGDILCAGGNALNAYRLKNLTPTAATFERIGQYQPTILERVFGAGNFWGIQMKNGLVYQGGNNYTTVFNPIISIFDTAGHPPMKMIGHFAAAGVQGVCPLPDGRAVVGGSKLWLVGPPPHRDSQ